VPERACTVGFIDSRGVRHSVEITADSLFEAAVLGLKALRSADLKEPPSRTSVFEIEVRQPTTRHRVSLVQVAQWLNGPASSPRESMKKMHLRKLLASK
jgi:hypothetical protein